MVTRPVAARWQMRRRAISDYLRQDHADRELLIVVDRGSGAERARIAAMIEKLGRPDIRLLLTDGKMSLGALRNLSVRAACGDALCQWDDDDFHHLSRISSQLAAADASGMKAVMLADVMMLDVSRDRLFWTNWARTPAGGHPATLLWHRNAAVQYPETGPFAKRGEDLCAVLALRERGVIHCHPDAPQLYVYVAHGGNTSGEAHHAMLIEALAISKGLLGRREDMLRKQLAAVTFGRPLSVEGPNGSAFTI